MSGRAAAPLGELQLDALREVGTIGAGTAATALSRLTGALVRMEVPRASVLPVERIPDEVGGGDALIAAVLVGVGGDAPGRMLFLMPADAAREVVDGLLRATAAPADEGPGFGEMALSALQELGGILTGSYLAAMATLTGLRLEPTPPVVGVDLAEALLGSALVGVAAASETALLIETGFAGPGVAPVGRFLYIPTAAALETVLGRLGVRG